MTDSMIERCTKAAMEEVRRQLGGKPIPGVPAPPAGPDSWAAQGDPACIDFALVARVIIGAMREPTEEMQEAALRTIVRENKGIEYGPSEGHDRRCPSPTLQTQLE